MARNYSKIDRKRVNSRIRYKKTKVSGVLKSMRRFIGNQGAIYEVILDTNEMKYAIRNVRKSMHIKSTDKDGITPPTHLHTLKIQAKRALLSLGVNMSIELRGVDL